MSLGTAPVKAPDPKPDETGSGAGEELLVASQWQLIRWKFLQHKVAVASLVVLTVLYLGALFAEFLSPYDPRIHDVRYLYSPPHRIHFVDENGKFSLRPFVYPLTATTDPRTYLTTYLEDQSEQHSLRFFVRGDPYKMWGLFAADLHLFGTTEGEVFLLGTDKLGYDMLSRLIYASRISLTVGLVGIAVSFTLGILIGGISGYFGGVVDLIFQRVIEFILSIPSLPLWMGLSAALPLHWSTVKVYFGIIVILSLVGWTSLARVVRGKFMSLREEDFVLAAKLHGARERRIIFRHLLPSFYSYIIASLTLSIPGMILGETALSFIGLGLQFPAISWGVLLKDAQGIYVLANAPWLLTPALIVIVTVLAFNFVGDGLRDAADPYQST